MERLVGVAIKPFKMIKSGICSMCLGRKSLRTLFVTGTYLCYSIFDKRSLKEFVNKPLRQ